MSSSILKNNLFKTGVSLSILSATGALAYYYFNEGPNNDDLVYSDKNLIAVTQLIHRNYFPIYLRISKQGKKLNN